MKLSDIFSQLAYGELSQLALVDSTTGLIDVARYAPLVAHTNLGLTALYKRFHLKESRLSFMLYANQVNYPLSSQESILGEGGEDFNDDILKVERVNTDGGVELGLNDASDPYGCTTPSAAVLRVPLALVNKVPGLPTDLVTDNLEVIYRANHPIIVYSGSSFNPARVEVELPYTHLEPLLLFIASRVHSPMEMTSINARVHTSNNYATKYEQSCARLEHDGLEVDQGSQNTRAHRNGWV